MDSESKLRANEEVWVSRRGEVRISNPSPGVTVYRLSGYIAVESVATFIRASERFQQAAGQIQSFVDCEMVTGYDSEVRTRVVAASNRIKRQITTHLLVRSKIVAMGLSLAATMTGSAMVSYTDRERFEAALRETLRHAG